MSQKLTQKQLYAISMLMEGSSAGMVALTLKLRRETVSRWQRMPEFKAEYTRIKNEMRGDLKSQLSDLLMTTIQAMKGTIISSDSNPKRIESLLNVIKTLGIDLNKEGKIDKSESNNNYNQ